MLKLLYWAGCIAGGAAFGIALIEVLLAILQILGYLFQNILSSSPKTLSEIQANDWFLKQFGKGVFDFHGMYSVTAVPVFLGLGTALMWVSGRAKAEGERQEQKLETERNNQKALEAKREAEERAKKKRNADLQALIKRANTIADILPKNLMNAKRSLMLAEREFGEGMLDPFWDAVELATRSLASFHLNSQDLVTVYRNFHSLALECSADGVDTPNFPIRISKIPGAFELSAQLTEIIRQSQRSHDFTSIFHMRRTNDILVEGFTTFGQALTEMGEKISVSVCNVTSAVGSLEFAVRDVGEELAFAISKVGAEQALASEILQQGTQTVVDVQRTHADNDERIIDTLDNIQRGRKPADFDYKPGTVKK